MRAMLIVYLPASRRAAATKTAATAAAVARTAASAAPGATGRRTAVAPPATAALARALIGSRQDLGNQRHHENHDGCQKCRRKRAGDVPGQRADDTAGDRRAEQCPEQVAHERTETKQHEQGKNRIDVVEQAPGLLLWLA